MDLLAGLNALHHLDTDGFGFNPIDEIPRHLEIDIRLQQRHPYLTEGFADVFLRNLPEPPQIAKRILQFAT